MDYDEKNQMESFYKQNQGYVIFSDTRIPYKIIKSSRSTMAISISKEAVVVVRIPNRLSYEKGHELARNKSKWIYKHYMKISEGIQKHTDFKWIDGASLELHGEIRLLRIHMTDSVKRVKVEERAHEIVVTGANSSAEMVKSAVINWYRKQAGSYLIARTRWWALRMNAEFLKISVRDQATRWGSCSAKGCINYNWRLILLPTDLTDYVIVHELAHLKEMNHSKNFWDLVEQELPDYMQRRRRLKDYEIQINSKY